MAVYRVPVTLTSPILGGVGVNTWHVRSGEVPGSPNERADLQAMVNAIREFYTGIVGIYAGGTGIAFDGTLRSVSEPDPVVQTITGFATGPGGNPAPLPPALAICPTLRTSSPTRSGRGRVFLSPVAVNTLQDNGTPLESSRSTIQGRLNTLIDASSGIANGGIVVWSPTQRLGRDIVGADVPNEYAVLRSRRD